MNQRGSGDSGNSGGGSSNEGAGNSSEPAWQVASPILPTDTTRYGVSIQTVSQRSSYSSTVTNSASNVSQDSISNVVLVSSSSFVQTGSDKLATHGMHIIPGGARNHFVMEPPAMRTSPAFVLITESVSGVNITVPC